MFTLDAYSIHIKEDFEKKNEPDMAIGVQIVRGSKQALFDKIDRKCQ